MINRNATAVWNGTISDGDGTITTQSTALDSVQYSFKSRFDEGVGTNPEELIAAAHSGCFTMAFSLFLGNAGYTPETLTTTATVSLDKVGEGFEITAIALETTGVVPNITAEEFETIATNAKENCPISKLLNADITLNATLAETANA